MKQLFLILMLLSFISASAQNKLTISGKVTDENYKPVNLATIFIGGTQLATVTNAEGKFDIAIANGGAYRVLVKLMGYETYSKDVLLSDKPIDLDITLTVKPIQLRQVNIGADKNWAKYYAIFKEEFLGMTDNGKGCEILNPGVINFSTREGQLYADADDFLIIENKRLGYRIKYLLQTFRHKQKTVNTAYNGDAVFEELPGTQAQKQEWAKNRLETYTGSMMHFFRAVFSKTVLQEGFLANLVYTTQNGTRRPYKEPAPFERLSTRIDSTFISLKFNDLAVNYDPKKAALFIVSSDTSAHKKSTPAVNLSLTNKKIPYRSELFIPPNKEAMIDSRGSVSFGYFLTFLVLGDWIQKRVGDQLPFEYLPPVNITIPNK